MGWTTPIIYRWQVTNELAATIFLARPSSGWESRNSKDDSLAPISRMTQFWTSVAFRESTKDANAVSMKQHIQQHWQKTYSQER